MRFILLLSVPALLSAQIKDDPAERIRAAMQTSLQQQMQSVRRQVTEARETSGGGFFTVPWPSGGEAGEPVTASCDPIPEVQLAPLIESAAKREDLKPALLRQVIQKESAGRPCAVSAKGAQGLMQLMPTTASDFGVSDPFDPKANVDAGAKYLKQLLVKYGGDVALALAAYNSGPARVDRAGDIPKIEETQIYVKSILDKLHSLQ